MKDEKSIEVDGWRVYDLPVHYLLSDYEQARLEVIAKAENTPDLVALFEFGYIPALGISDMDFWAVFADDAEKMSISPKPELSEKTAHIISHEPLVISEKHYRKMLYFDPWTTNIWPNGQRLLFKKEGINRNLDFEKIELSSWEKEILSLGRIEELMATIFSTIPLYAKKELPARDIMESIKSCIYIVREVSMITKQEVNTGFSESLKDLMVGWFEMNEREAIRKLIKLFHESLLLMFDISIILGNWLETHASMIPSNDIRIKKVSLFNGSKLDDNEKNIYLNTFRGASVYSSYIKNSSLALEMSINSCRKNDAYIHTRLNKLDSPITYLPFNFSSIVLGFIFEHGFLSDRLRKDIYTNQEIIPVFMPDIFREKIRMINEITDIYNKKQDEAGGGKGWLFGNNRFGYSFNHEKIRRKILTSLLKRKYWRIINGKI